MRLEESLRRPRRLPGRLLRRRRQHVPARRRPAGARGSRRRGHRAHALSGSGEVDDAHRRAVAIGARHEIIDLDLAAAPEVLANPPDRCYHCKRLVFTALRRRADELGLPALLDATHADDLRERRPGVRALRELGVVSPLAAAGLGKADIRALSAALGIEGAERPSSPCLATRVPYGTPITPERLRRISGAEHMLRALGFAGTRVRDYGDLARIELQPADLERAAAWPLRRGIVEPLRDLGYRYVTLDLAGYRSGSMDEVLPASERAPPRSRLPTDVDGVSTLHPGLAEWGSRSRDVDRSDRTAAARVRWKQEGCHDTGLRDHHRRRRPGRAHRGNLRVAGAPQNRPAREARHRRADGADLGGRELPRRREDQRLRSGPDHGAAGAQLRPRDPLRRGDRASRPTARSSA